MNSNSILPTAREAFLAEINGLQEVAAAIDRSFEEAVLSINNSLDHQAKIIVTGIGKSADVGRKMVATFNSTGTPAQFLHAGEAMHGDLGIINSQDIILAISYSGSTPELLQMLPFAKNYSSHLIAITGNADSPLARESDFFISCKVSTEACPMNLAPTTSTTAMMVIGDAIAICLMQLRKFSPEIFAKYHPGGALGKNLTTKVSEFLSSEKPAIDVSQNFREAIISITKSKMGITVVCENSQLKGVITDGDVRRILLQHENPNHIIVGEIMTKNPKTIQKNELAREALAIMKQYNIGQLVVLDGDTYLGIISLHTLLEQGIH